MWPREVDGLTVLVPPPAAMKRVLEQELLTMEIIVNPKTLPNGTNVIQLETAVGAAMKCFNGATGGDCAGETRSCGTEGVY